MMVSRIWRQLALAGLLMAAPSAWAASPDATAPLVAQGEYVFRAAGCLGCHTDHKHRGKPLAGGRALATPFGIFYTPNITPDAQTGIGKWSARDLAAIAEYVTSLPPIEQSVGKAHKKKKPAAKEDWE